MLMDELARLQLAQKLIRIASHISGVHFIGDDLSFRVHDKGAPLRYAVRLSSNIFSWLAVSNL